MTRAVRASQRRRGFNGITEGLRHVADFDPEEVLERLGGVVLGLRTAQALAHQLASWSTPPFVVLPVRTVRSEPNARLCDLAPALSGSTVVIKTSGVGEAFSPSAARGANSSLMNGRLVIDESTTVTALTGVLHDDDSRVRAIVLQRFASVSNGCSFIVHCDGEQCLIECVHRGHSFLFVFDSQLRLADAESTLADRSTTAVTDLCDVNRIAELHMAANRLLGFALNTEGFFVDGQFVALQLRPVPNDMPQSSDLRSVVDGLREVAIARTRFVHGTFDMTGLIRTGHEVGPDALAPQDLILCADRQLRGGHQRGRQAHALEALGLLNPHEAADTTKESGRPPWDSPIYRSRVRAGLQTVFVDFDRGFHLNHKPEYLPPIGPLRDYYRYVALPRTAQQMLGRQMVRLVSDGTQGLLVAL